ncbi:hypothetical protein QJS10_CPB21g00559 [Acorus calamus]|uniref:Uncharacterized protein n=1 Tax=Acorus calamus TaxID=4465 RepID=A0AAV9C6E9_ACOCL|nr:hypothetical protein QJS10_CPB21g00559 [Acorus calamus]
MSYNCKSSDSLSAISPFKSLAKLFLRGSYGRRDKTSAPKEKTTASLAVCVSMPRALK